VISNGTNVGGQAVCLHLLAKIAAVNCFWLTSQLALVTKARGARQRAFSAHTLIEIALALAIFAVVGVLGTLHPAIHLVN